MFRRLTQICTIGALLGIGVLSFQPLNITFLRLALLGCIAAALGGPLILFWKNQIARKALLLLSAAPLAIFYLPGREIDKAELSSDYVSRMSSFEGTPYFWGGENSRGIDCSGLPRRALRDALLWYGVKHANGRAIRAYIEHWWFDASAQALGDGYRGYTTPLGIATTIRDFDFTRLHPGDLAVTTSGTHILAYIGGGKWIQADPGIGFVATLNGQADRNPWFTNPVTMHRWQLLSDPVAGMN